MIQKFVTIFLAEDVRRDKHGKVEEHLDEYLKEGWRITDVRIGTGACDYYGGRGWVGVILEKTAAQYT